MPNTNEIEYIDSPEISGSMDDTLNVAAIFPTSGMTRRQLIDDAKRLAGNSDPSKGWTWSDFVNNRVMNQDKFSRREDLYRRKFNKQLKKNLRLTEQRQLLEAAKAGDANAFGKYVGNEMSDNAKYFSWIPGAAGAGALITSGALGAGAGAIKSLFANPYSRSALDIMGTADSIKNVLSDNGIAKTIRLAKEGDIWGTVKSAAGDVFDVVGTTDAFLNPELRQAFKWYTEDSINALKNLKTANQTLGLTPWSGLRSHVVRPGSVHPNLGRYDVQNLLDRGYTSEQIAQLNDVMTNGVTGNVRANILADRLSQMGIMPQNQSRRQYLEQAAREGQMIYTDSYGRPITADEARNIPDARPSSLKWLRTYYPDTASRAPISFYDDASYKSVRDNLVHSLPLLSKDQAIEVRHIIENAEKQGLSPAELEGAIREYFSGNDLPYGRLKTEHVPQGATYSKHVLHNYGNIYEDSDVVDVLQDLLSDDSPLVGNYVRNTAYNAENVPFEWILGMDDYGYNSFGMFQTHPKELIKWKQRLFDLTPHGGLTTEANKSLQSSTIAYRDYVNRVKNGDGVIVFAKNPEGGYHRVRTNNFAQTPWRPELIIGSSGPKIVSEQTSTLFNRNLDRLEDILNHMDPRVLEQFNGEMPTFDLNFEGPWGELAEFRELFGNVNPGILPSFTVNLPYSKDPTTGLYKFDRAAAQKHVDAFDQMIAAKRPLVTQRGIENLQKILPDPIDLGGFTFRFENGVPEVISEFGHAVDPIEFRDDLIFELKNKGVDHTNAQSMVDSALGLKALPYNMSFDVPLIGFRKFNKGGILNNLSKQTCKLLNIFM